MLNLTRLRVFASVARHGSVTRAAHELHYAQPSVSHHLARLEEEVGLALVERVGRGIRLTPDGELLARRATEILARIESTEDELASRAGLRTGRVRVAGFQSVLCTLVARAAARLHASSPGIEITLTDLHPDLALERLREGTIDVAVVFRYDDVVPDGLTFQHVFDDPMYLISLERRQTLADHRDSPWIAGCERCRTEMVEACQGAGFTPRIAYTSDDHMVEQSLVAAGLGVTTVPGLALETYRAPGIHASEVPTFRRRVSIATFGAPPRAPATEAFLHALSLSAAQV
jgi:DNA-binding transcriptional LysR family regulator